jgi:DNA-directed RNA polymerase sigma subunit (sigma70/sigma32)
MANNSGLSAWIKRLYKYKVLTTEQEFALWQQMQKGNAAAEAKLIAHNLRFVVSEIKQMPVWQVSALPREDLIQAGNMALIKAARKWTPMDKDGKPIRFCTYAKQFIHLDVKRAVSQQQHIIKIPVRVAERTRKMLWVEGRLMQKLNRTPTREELAQALGVHPMKVDELKDFIRREPCSLDVILAATYNSDNQDGDT